MKRHLIYKFQLNNIEIFDESKCSETLTVLRYLWLRTGKPAKKKEIEMYMHLVHLRCTQLKIQNQKY